MFIAYFTSHSNSSLKSWLEAQIQKTNRTRLKNLESMFAWQELYHRPVRIALGPVTGQAIKQTYLASVSRAAPRRTPLWLSSISWMMQSLKMHSKKQMLKRKRTMSSTQDLTWILHNLTSFHLKQSKIQGCAYHVQVGRPGAVKNSIDT